jgi:predicted MFS family arabinose efflux permease
VLRWLFGDEGSVAAESELQVVLTATAMAVTGIYAMSPILSALTGPFGVSDARIGAVITAYTAPSVVLVPLVGLVADRFGRRRLLVAGLLLFGLAGAAVALTTDFTVVLVLRVVQGRRF